MKCSSLLASIALLFFLSGFSMAQPLAAQTPSTQSPPASSPLLQHGTSDQASYATDPKFQKALEAAHEKHLPTDERLARWKKAFKVSNGRCLDCLHEVIVYQLRESQWKDAVNSCTQLETLATDPKYKFFAEAERGEILLQGTGGSPKPDQLRDAEGSLSAALQLEPHSGPAIYSEGRALAMMGRDPEAKAMFQRYLDQAGEADKYRTRAEHFMDNPRLAALPMAPPFTVTTAEGAQINLDEQVGKVVLLDFWATWCGPCKQTLPVIHALAKKFAGQPLVVVSISGDRDEEAWKQFVASHDMFWAQYRDTDGRLSSAYGVTTIPRFFTIDSDGVLKNVKVGTEAADGLEGDLAKLLKQAAQAAQKKALMTDKAAGV